MAEAGDHLTAEAKPASPTLNVAKAHGDHFLGKLEFDASTPLIERPFLAKVANTRGKDRFYAERVSLEAVARSLSHLKVEGVFGKLDYDFPDFGTPQIKCRLACGLWMDVEYLPAWPWGAEEIAFLRHVEVFVELANILGSFIVPAAHGLRSAIGRARYHEGMSLNYFAKGDDFSVGARGHGVDPNDMEEEDQILSESLLISIINSIETSSRFPSISLPRSRC
jgi:hypothetical protein